VHKLQLNKPSASQQHKTTAAIAPTFPSRAP
jgi:hypothetical protein